MRTLTLTATILLTTACSGDRLSFDYESQMMEETRGVALHDDGELGLASMTDPNTGMGTTTCEFWTDARGVRDGDYDLPGGNERVIDAMGTTVLAKTQRGVHLVNTDNWPEVNNVELDNVRDARLFDGGVAVVHSTDADCNIDWRTDTASPVSVALPGNACATGVQLTVNRLTGEGFVAAGTDVIAVSPDGSETIAADADLIRWDEGAEMLFIASLGDSEVRGISADGTPAWSAGLSGPVYDLETIGSEGRAAFMTEAVDGTGEILIVDGFTGQVDQGINTPELADIVFSGDGGTMALVTPTDVHFYGVTQDGGTDVYWSKEAAGVQPPPAFND